MNEAKDRLDDSDVWNIFGDQIICKISGSQTLGRFAVVEETSPPLNAMLPYVHKRTVKIFYVLEGTYEAVIGERTFVIRKGDMIPVPQRTEHYFRNLEATQSRLLIFITPGGFENFFAEVSQLRTTSTDDIARIGRKYDFDFNPRGQHSDSFVLRETF